jgi:hypothetical protein
MCLHIEKDYEIITPSPEKEKYMELILSKIIPIIFIKD